MPWRHDNFKLLSSPGISQALYLPGVILLTKAFQIRRFNLHFSKLCWLVAHTCLDWRAFFGTNKTNCHGNNIAQHTSVKVNCAFINVCLFHSWRSVCVYGMQFNVAGMLERVCSRSLTVSLHSKLTGEARRLCWLLQPTGNQWRETAGEHHWWQSPGTIRIVSMCDWG